MPTTSTDVTWTCVTRAGDHTPSRSRHKQKPPMLSGWASPSWGDAGAALGADAEGDAGEEEGDAFRLHSLFAKTGL